MNNLSERFANYFNLPKRDNSVNNIYDLGERVLKVLNTKKDD